VCEHNDRLYANNECATCNRARSDRYRRRRRLGIALLHAVEARGLSGSEALALIQHADFATLQSCHNADRRTPAE
jgi:hypothetical protein